MLKSFLIVLGVLSSLNASIDSNSEENGVDISLIVEHLDRKFSQPHVLSLSDISAAILEVFPEIDRDKSLQLQVDIGILYLTR